VGVVNLHAYKWLLRIHAPTDIHHNDSKRLYDRVHVFNLFSSFPHANARHMMLITWQANILN